MDRFKINKSLEKNIDELREKIIKLKNFMQSIPGFQDIQLDLEIAKDLQICRICKKDMNCSPNGLFVLNFGKEFVHKSCLEKLG